MSDPMAVEHAALLASVETAKAMHEGEPDADEKVLAHVMHLAFIHSGLYTRKCGGTHLMGYGECQQVRYALSRLGYEIVPREMVERSQS